jgi:LysR family transcriptional regulator, carnitine catabolism transcriptional activator
MNTRHLEFVLALADHGSFTRAAEAVHISQPSLSHAIAQIESDVGTLLFHRLGRTVSLTSAGEAFVESARVVLRDLNVMYESVKSVEKIEGGTLDVAAPHASAAELLARLVGEFRSRHPGVRVRIETAENPHEIERYVRTGRCEIALAVEPVDPPLVSELIGSEENLVVFPPGTKLKRRPVKHADLAGLPMIVPTGTYQYYGMILQVSPPEKAPFVAVETASRQALIPLVLAGAGFSFLPRALAEGAACQGLVIAALDPSLRRDIRLVTRVGPLSPAARVFADLARGVAGTHVGIGRTRLKSE